MTIAQTIYNQLGGNKFKVMTGARSIEAHKTGLSFKIGRNASSCNHIIINLNEGSDTYDMLFERVTVDRKTFDFKRKTIAKKEGVYCDMLTDIFTDVTGLYTSL